MLQDYVGPVMIAANQKRGVQMNMQYHGRQVMLISDAAGEITVLTPFDKLSGVPCGAPSMHYEFKEYRGLTW